MYCSRYFTLYSTDIFHKLIMFFQPHGHIASVNLIIASFNFVFLIMLCRSTPGTRDYSRPDSLLHLRFRVQSFLRRYFAQIFLTSSSISCKSIGVIFYISMLRVWEYPNTHCLVNTDVQYLICSMYYKVNG